MPLPARMPQTVKRFCQDFGAHQVDPQNVKEVCCDMSPAFIQGVEQNLVNARFTFDKFHAMKIANDAVDQVRREEQKQHSEPKHSPYRWLKYSQNLKASRSRLLEKLSSNLLNFQEFWQQPQKQAKAFLKRCYFWTTQSRLRPMIDAARAIKHIGWEYCACSPPRSTTASSRASTRLKQPAQGGVQGAKTRVRGYRSDCKFITMIYLLAGKLKFDLTT